VRCGTASATPSPDLAPTILDALGITPPSSVNGTAQAPIEGSSIAASLFDPAVPIVRGPQYFEMFGHRGIVADGWKAVAYHQLGTPFENDTWELYHLESDFAENLDLAATEPDRLSALVDLWWREADAHKVLPLDDRFAQRFAENAARHTGERTRYTFWRGMGHIPSDVAPDLRSRSYTITADVVVPEDGCEGVLVAHGDLTTGWSLFIRDGHLEHDLNVGGSHQMLRSSIPVPAGEHRLGVRMRRVGNEGTLTMFIDDREVGEMTTSSIFWLLISWSGLDIGLDRGTPVSHYESPFTFTGFLRKVEIVLDTDQKLDMKGATRATLSRD